MAGLPSCRKSAAFVSFRRYGRNDGSQRPRHACDVYGERRAGLPVGIGVFVPGGFGMQPAAAYVYDARRVAFPMQQAGQVTDGRPKRIERRIAFQYQNVEQTVVAFGEIGQRQRSGGTSVEDEKDDGAAVEVAAVRGDGEFHFAETRQVAYSV